MIFWLHRWLRILGTAGLLALMFRWFRQRSITCNCRTACIKHVVITGANSGIGYAAALELARLNWHVTLACRNLDSAERVRKEIIQSTNNEHITVQKLDLTQRASIDDFVKTVATTPVHVLINNAGLMASTARPVGSFGGVNVDTATNYLGTFYLTRLMLPYLRQVRDDTTHYPRVIFVTSGLSTKGNVDDILRPWTPGTPWNVTQAYANSKLACCLFARELHRRFGSGPNKWVNVYCLFTGGMVNTGLSREIISQYSLPSQWVLRLLSRMLLKSPYAGCQSLVHCAVSQNVASAHCMNTTLSGSNVSGNGLLYSNCAPIPWPTAMQNVHVSQLLWKQTMDFLGLRD
ncbi:uncharacterized protein DEA37_0000276 [Paragonimus westermani]|uniref:Retinol dehydrogenase 12 n=1 Tax=Paragonimus westermani TaxID=34504 RepID=A0A5J4NTK8_9TREM|nr:uncharacterized protein DEA37_0000276 [Paragonimus westermani]